MKKNMMFFLIAVLCFAAAGCEKAEDKAELEKIEKNTSAEQADPMLFTEFTDPDVEKLLAEKNVVLEKLRIFSKADVEKMFQNIFQCKVIESDSVTDNADNKEKTFIINQYVSNIPVFAATTVLRCNAEGKIIYFSSSFSVQATKLQVKPRELTSDIQKKLFGNSKVSNVCSVIFVPALMGLSGETVMAWRLECFNQLFLIDQQSCKKVLNYPLYMTN